MKYVVLSFSVFGLSLGLAGCSDNPEEVIQTQINTKPVAVDTEAMVAENSAPVSQAEETEPSIVDLEVAAPEPTSVTAEVNRSESSVETENRVVAQEQPVGDNPVMNPAGETLIQTARVTFPDGNERIEVGKDYQIRWESEGLKALEIEVHQFGRRTAVIADRALAVEGVYNWTPEATLLRGNDFAQLTIVLKDADTGIVHDESDRAFILVKP